MSLDLDLGWHTWRKHESVRLAGIDTPEPGRPGGAGVSGGPAAAWST